MEVLVKWRDGTKNVVNSKELKVVNKPKTLQKGSEVQMRYEGEWYLGTVVATEDEDSADDLPLINFVGLSKEVTDNISHANRTVNLKNSSTIQILQNITIKAPLAESTNKITKQSGSLDLTIVKEVNRTLNIMSEHVSKPQIFPDTTFPNGYQSNEETPYSDNSDLDSDYKIDCEMSECVKKSQTQCACGFWLCKFHFLNTNYCDIHEFRDQSLEGPAKLKKIYKQNKEYRKQNCEFENCIDEVFAACHKCQALLCWTHFDVEEQNCLYHQVPSLSGSLQDVVLENVKPSHFTLEGSPREIKRKQKISKFSMKNKAKKQKLLGEGYIVPNTMNQVPPKILQAPCESEYCKKFGKKCHIFTSDQRNDILTCFYAMGNLEQQRGYICRHVKISNPKNMKENSRKKVRYDYFLPFLGENVCVCKIFFLNTLAISDKVLRTSLKKLQPTGVVETEKRGGRTEKQLQRDAMVRKTISEHIHLFPKVESHYCRKTTGKEYLHPELTIPKMYELYRNEHKDQDIGGIELYRKIFQDMNLSFHRPKKDQCSLCRTFRDGNDDIKNNLKEKYTKHNYEKTAARKIKQESKEMALNQEGLVSAVFDLQQIIHLPISNESALFYKQRLAVYNFTIYNLATRDCNCYTWNETVAKRGASEIATCVFMFLKRCDDEGKVSVDFFSDGCQGQNKKSILPAMFLYFLKDSKNIQNITHYFFESFHGQNEGDSVHSTISSAISRAGNVYVPSQIIPIIRLARRRHPYIVHELEVSDFLDFKMVSKELRLLSIRKCSEDTSDSSDSINWTQFLSIKVEKKALAKIYFKTSYSQENYKSLSLPRNTNLNRIQVTQLNVANQKLAEKKYVSLLSLCQGLTPIIRLKEYQDFYKNLPH